ncbi:FtsX-like permease family protein [compost metagenome]
MYLPYNEFSNLVKEPLAMNFIFNVSPDNMDNFESFLKDYTTSLNPIMNYDSKTLFLNKFKDMQNLILILGGSLSIIIGLIGLLNFINSILTTIIARKKEFAILQSIGMTNKQLLRLLIYEGLIYSGITSLMSIILGSLFSFVILKKLLNNMWFTNYSFTLYPLLITIPLIAVISIIIPLIIYRFSSNESVVEKLKELD